MVCNNLENWLKQRAYSLVLLSCPFIRIKVWLTTKKRQLAIQWRIQDFPQGGAPTPKIAIIFHIFAENCMKMKEFGPPGGGAHPWRPPLDPPMQLTPMYLYMYRSGTLNSNTLIRSST